MRSRLWIAVVGVTVLAVALGGIAFAAGGPARSSGAATAGAWGRGYLRGNAPATQAPAGTKETLHLVDVTQRSKLVDADGSGSFSVGDYVVFTENVYDQGHNLLGHSFIHCLVNYGAVECSGGVALNGQGTIVVHGLLGQNNGPIAVVGGTGHFATASGVAVVHPSNSDTTEITVYLI